MKRNNNFIDTTTNTAKSTASKKKLQTNIPRKDVDLATLAIAVDDKWATTPALTLLWIDEPKFKILVHSFNTNLNNRLLVGSNRPSVTQSLAQINTSIDEATDCVKVYILKKFKKASAKAQYHRYGIAKEGSNYRLPFDNDKRKLALPLMLAAINEDGFANEEYGTIFWQNIKTSFINALNNSSDIVKNVSKKVAAKDADKKKIKQILVSIILLIKANYPATYKNVLREWGFIKENY
jgi:hypothetical protein